MEAGTYAEQIRLRRHVTLRSTGDDAPGQIGLARAEATVIHSQGKSPAVILEATACMDGFTVTGSGQFDLDRFNRHHAERGENLLDAQGAVGAGGSSAIQIDNVSARVVHCIVRDNGHPGVALSGSDNRSTVEANYVFRNMGGGIGIADGARCRVYQNHCWKNLRAGIGCRNASPLIQSNRCFQNVRAGIGIREAAAPCVRDNECFENQRAGIGIRMRGTEPLVVGNRCYKNGMAGVGCRDEASPVILNNVCCENRLAGIGASDNAQPIIVSNRIYRNQAAAIGLDACESGQAWLHANQIEADTLVALGIQRGWVVDATSNQFERVGGMPPLVMVFQGARANFVGNRFEGSGVAAIRSQGQIVVSDNHFVCPNPRKGGPPQRAIWPLPGSSWAMTDDNRIQGWQKTGNLAQRVTNRDELDRALRKARPGTTILLEPGDYAGGLLVENLHGEPDRPIVIASARRSRPAVIRGGTSGLQLIRPRHVALLHLKLVGASGNGLNIDDGGRAEAPARDIHLHGLVVQDIGPRGNRDGIKLSGVQQFRVARCRITRWGDAGSGMDMVGCHDGLILGSQFRHRAGDISGNGVQAKGGSSRIAIRHCRFDSPGHRAVNLGGATGAEYFRPKDAEFEAKDIAVTDCLVHGAPLAFVGVIHGQARNNCLYHPGRWALRILQQNNRLAPGRDGVFSGNLTVFFDRELRQLVNIGPNTAPKSFRFDGNTWFCQDRPGRTRSRIQLPVQETGATYAIPETERGTMYVPGSGVRWLPGKVR